MYSTYIHVGFRCWLNTYVHQCKAWFTT